MKEEKLVYYSGVLRITNPKTIERWKQNGEYQRLIDEGYHYGGGCGRFRDHPCQCYKCIKFNKKNQLLCHKKEN